MKIAASAIVTTYWEYDSGITTKLKQLSCMQADFMSKNTSLPFLYFSFPRCFHIVPFLEAIISPSKYFGCVHMVLVNCYAYHEQSCRTLHLLVGWFIDEIFVHQGYRRESEYHHLLYYNNYFSALLNKKYWYARNGSL